MRFSSSRTMQALALTAIGVVMAVGPALGHEDGDDDGHRGKTGRHAFVDSESRPGARCLYAPAEPTSDEKLSVAAAMLVGVAVRPPKVAAIDRTDRVDHQRVGWRFIVQQQIGDGEWTNVRRSSLQVRRTTDNHAARFARMAVRVKSSPEANYRVITRAYWFKGRLRPVGMAFHGVDYYAVRGGVTKSYCLGGVPSVDADTR